MIYQSYQSRMVTNVVGYIDVGDGCWRLNVLMTSLRCLSSPQNATSPITTVTHHSYKLKIKKTVYQS